ncbi:hypothetical protein ACIBHX_46890 [Nonomuraea sp. NPDC050536]|uniref:hypothetical protein n=1 Tax=Nonomuraea sp. NPDC050536 TaxID=3364366 RepID=UPI0037C9776A
MATSRRCWQCDRPLRVTARTDMRYCGTACRAKARRRRLRWKKEFAAEMIATSMAHLQDRVGRRCPSCGVWFAPGVGIRRDARYCSPRCRTAAWRARQHASSAAQPLRQAVTSSRTGDGSGAPTSG